MVQLRVAGTVDLEESYEAQAALAVMAEEREPVLLDLSGAQFVDSRFLQRLLSLDRRRTAMGRRFAIVAPRLDRERIFRMRDLQERFALYDDAEAALADLDDEPLDQGPELA
jgi:anti-anti-sigma factor